MSAESIIHPEIEQIVNDHEFPEGDSMDFVYHLRESWIRDLGQVEACYYALITSLSTRFGFCYISNAKIAEKFNDSERTVERILMNLEKKRWIFRNTYSLGKGRGSKRYMVTKEHAITYWKNHLSKPKIPMDIKQKFIKHFFGDDDGELLKAASNIPSNVGPAKSCMSNVGPAKSCTSYQPPKSVAPFILTDKTSVKEERESTSTSILDVHKVEKELRDYGFRGEQIEVGKAYFEAYRSDILNKRKPMGYVIMAVEKGFAADELERHDRRETAVADAEEKLEDNKRKAAKIYAELKDKQNGFRIKLEENMIYFDFRDSLLPLGWRDENFDQLLSVARSRAYALLRNSDQACGMATC